MPWRFTIALAAACLAVAPLAAGGDGKKPYTAETAAYGAKGVTPLMVAAANGDLAEVRRLVEAKADVNARCEPVGSGRMNVGGWTPLLLAAREGHVEVADLLLKSGADVHAATANTRTVLGEAIKQPHDARTRVALVKLFLAAKADPNRPTGQGELPLMLAATLGHHDVIGPLLAAGAAVDGVTRVYDVTPLMCAARTGQAKAVALLLKAGADRSKRNRDGLTALEIAKAEKHQEVVDLLAAGR